MKSLWNEKDAQKFRNDPLQMRVYTSRLIGQEDLLVLHGGGNTSVKTTVTDIFGEAVEILYVKGSGWDLATIEAEGFAPVRLETLKKMAELDSISDTDMVNGQRAAMLDPKAPNPSVEAILHAIIPCTFVDHTHSDAVVAITDTENGAEKIREVYGERMLIIPYVMPGYLLAKYIYEKTKGIDWEKIDGMVLLNHGIFTFHNDARKSYENMIEHVTRAENFLEKKGAYRSVFVDSGPAPDIPFDMMAKLRKEIAQSAGMPLIVKLDASDNDRGFVNRADAASIAARGPVTPNHILWTKHLPMVMTGNAADCVKHFAEEYRTYFERNTDGGLTALDPAPRWVVWPGIGNLAVGRTPKECGAVSDIIRQSISTMQWGEALGGWKSMSEENIFQIEYWELEQAKMKLRGKLPVFQGKIVLVTGAASGIGRACAEAFAENGAAVAALDIDPDIEKMFDSGAVMGIRCDVTNEEAVRNAIEKTVVKFGGLDILVSNAGNFPMSSPIEELDSADWDRSMELNVTSHQKVLKACIPFLKQGIEPAIVINGSKNVPAPGPGASAYSVAKAALTQLARVAALELAPFGIRVNTFHANMIFDTGLWTQEALEGRAEHYGLTVEEYKTNNLLRTNLTSKNVAELAMAMAGPAFAKTTGAQVPVDGGNERVI